jgi:hypothetical protein
MSVVAFVSRARMRVYMCVFMGLMFQLCFSILVIISQSCDAYSRAALFNNSSLCSILAQRALFSSVKILYDWRDTIDSWHETKSVVQQKQY